MGEQNGTTERLELHNKALLIRSAQGKLSSGKRLTVAEIKAVEDVENEKKRSADLPFMRRIPKKEYIERFGGSNKVYLDWEELWGFPWRKGEKHVNALEILCWYREHVAGGTESATVDPDDHAARLKRAQADREELRLARDRWELLHVEEVEEDFRTWARKIADAIEAIGVINRDAQNVMLDALNGVYQEFGIEDETEEETKGSRASADANANGAGTRKSTHRRNRSA